MKFVEVKEIPKTLREGKYCLKHYWEEFMKMDVKVARVDLSDHDYKTVKNAQTTFLASIKRYGYPISASIRGGEIYLVRRDM